MRRWSQFVVLVLLAFALAAPSHADERSAVRAPLDRAYREAERLVRNGRVEEGIERFRQLYAEHPGDSKVALGYARTLVAAQRVEEALAVYTAAAARVEDPMVILQDHLQVLKQHQRNREALTLALEVLGDKGPRGSWAFGEAEEILRAPAMAAPGLELVGSAIARWPEVEAIQDLELSALLLNDQAPVALERAAALDRQRGANGGVLYKLAVACEKRGRLQDAMTALDRTLLVPPARDLEQEVLFDRARVLRKLRRLQEASDAFAALAAKYPQSGLAPRALRESAEILEGELHQFDRAREVYQRLLADVTPVRTARDAETANELQLAIANCNFMLGALDEAAAAYTQMAEQATDAAVRIEALFQVAEMYFYQGRMQEAETKYYEIVDQYPTASWVNDALDRILLIDENAGSGVALATLAQAEFQRRLGKVREALSLLENASEAHAGTEAYDDLMFRRVCFHLDLGEAGPARTVADSLAARVPESSLAPRALLEIADHYLEQPGGQAAAEPIYTDLLLRYPNSIEAPKARGALDRLRGRSRDSSALPDNRLSGPRSAARSGFARQAAGAWSARETA